ncbi:CaiB/BaiF CoA transferase family protein [Salipaludibacillus sp. CF4.18]|uniref:CaiB/BaiF CoA transferase family protein n=1 Tax=Salipaludibacillus sp. CF4.18 TaxID=3373081 RepID=UPI003EE5AEB2
MLALEGIKIVDLTRTLAGPFCTMLLGDMGAEVIKVERPSKGDEAREFTPPEWEGESCYFLSSNRNKRSITVNLKTKKGQEIVKKLVKSSDVLVENFKTGDLEKMGLGYEDLKKVNNKLIYCSISGFGRTGPEKNKAGYDLLIQGYSGLMSVTGTKNGERVKVGTSIADLSGGMFAVYGIMSALMARYKTGEGQLVDASLLDGQIMLLNHLATGYFATGKPASTMGSAHPTLVPYQAFQTKDIDIILAVGNDNLWEKCCSILKWDDLKGDLRFKTNKGRVANRTELVPIIEDRLGKIEGDQIIKKLDEVGVPCGPIHTLDQILTHPQVESREMMMELDHPFIDNLKVPGFPVKLSSTPAVVSRHPPLLGEHNEEVLKELGYTETEIDTMKKSNEV